MQRRFLFLLALSLTFFAGVSARAADQGLATFTVLDIGVEGLQRVSEGTVLNYLPVNVGDELNPRRVREALRALYETGFFRNVEIRRDGSKLVVVVTERPTIESFDIKGNKEIKTEDLTKSLRNAGLAAGKIFDRAVLEDVKQGLTEQYFSRGRYGVLVDATVDEQPDNRVRINIKITEGSRARIRQISIIGNTMFKEKDILSTFELKTPQWNSWYKQNDRYSKESLSGDLEKLRSFYQDRGYANFEIESAQVAISPEKDDMFITVSIREGEIYRVSDSRIAGNTIVPLEQLQRLLLVQKGQIYSQQMIAATQQLLENRLGAEGYAFAKVDPVPKLDDEKKEVVMTFLIDPGKRVYVRRIAFVGVTRTNDVVLRREIRQLEGAWVSNVALERSKQRLQGLPYIEKVDFEKKRVDGSDDLVDVEFKIKEGQSASLSGGIGYSESSSFSLNANLADSDFLGTGKRLAVDATVGTYAQVYSFSQTNPYITVDGVSRTTTVSYSRQTQLTSTYSDFSTETWLARLDFGWPISERQGIHFGTSLQRLEFATTTNSSTQLWQWVRNNGGERYLRRSGDYFIRGTISNVLELSAAWNYESRNRALFPTAGAAQSFTISSTVPGSELQYFMATYRFQQYFTVPLPGLRSVPFRISTTAGYGAAYGNTDALPPNRHWFVGGPDSVRGFRESTLGPRDSQGNPYGGDAALYGSAEAILPMPAKWQSSARLSLFVDYGEAFYLGDTQFRNKAGQLSDTSFDLQRLRSSAGIAVQWLAPMGLFRFSYAIPLSWQKETTRLYGDDVENFQFSIGNAF
jgi:outer membrane protein insertion porin family